MQPSDQSSAYPVTPTVDQVDDYHGVKVADPYRWLEDPNSDQTRAWVEAQNRVTFGYLEGIAERDRLKRRLTELWDYEKYGIPFKQGEQYFFNVNARYAAPLAVSCVSRTEQQEGRGTARCAVP